MSFADPMPEALNLDLLYEDSVRLIDKFREDPELLLRVQHYCPAFVTRVFDDAFALDQVVGWARNNLRRCVKFYSENKDVLNDDPDYC